MDEDKCCHFGDKHNTYSLYLSEINERNFMFYSITTAEEAFLVLQGYSVFSLLH